MATCDYGGPVVAVVERGRWGRPSSTPRSRAPSASRLLANFVAGAARAEAA